MKQKNAGLSNAVAGILALGGALAAGNAQAAVPDQPKNWEKCAGIAKAGMNDCGALDGKHACAGQAASEQPQECHRPGHRPSPGETPAIDRAPRPHPDREGGRSAPSDPRARVLGPGCPKCKKLYENTQQALAESGVEADLEKVEDIDEFIAPETVRWSGPGFRYDDQGWIFIHIEGEPYERGFQYGSLMPDEIAEYTGEQKNTGPVTLTTYQILTWRSDRESDFPHLELFRARSWGLIIYDEVHLLPAPVFRATADLQGRRRLDRKSVV